MWQIGGVTFLTAFVLSLAGTWLMKRIAPRIGLVDHPAARKVHVVPTPLGGGVAIWLSLVLTVALAFAAAAALQADFVGRIGWLPESVRRHVPGMLSRLRMVAVVLGLASVVSITGLIDDRRGLGWKMRFAVQISAVLVLISQGIRLTLLGPLANVWISSALTIVWIVGLTNSFNFLDNMDGLSGGVAWISSALFCVLMTLTGNFFVAGFLVAMLGALSGFLCFNWPPASIFMGDAGSNFVGFMIGVVTVVATFTTPALPPVTIAAPICVLAVPIYDTVTVILIRLREGRSPFQPDRSHFSHRLVALGMTKKQAVLTIYLVTLTAGLSALLLYPLSSLMPADRAAAIGAAIVLAQIACVLGVVAVLEAAGRKGANGDASQPSTHKS